MNTVRVTTASASYDVLAAPGLLARLGELCAARLSKPIRRAFIAHDVGLPATVIQRAVESLRAAGMEVFTAAVTAEETHKSLTDLETLLAKIAGMRLERSEPVIALGGGIVGDLAGFAAASYRRGVPVVQCPTTLLSMVDASVGGKTGVNLVVPAPGNGARASVKKNFVGAFHQPILVLADVETLRSLPARHLRSGLAECIKHGMISEGVRESAGSGGAAGEEALAALPADLFTWTRGTIPAVLAQDQLALAKLIAANVAVKAAVVGTDEREELPSEQGGRALLNLGHTFGHAIEPLPELSPDGTRAMAPLHHGEAVAVGLIAASRCAAAAGLCTAGVADAVEEVVARAGLPTRLANLPPSERLIELMADDKKVVGGKIRLVLPTGNRPGVCAVVDSARAEHIAAGWDAVRG